MTTYLWSNTAVNDLWSNASNWTPSGGPPGSGDDAILGSIGESVVVSGVDAAVDVLVVGFGATNAPKLTVNSGRTFTVNGAGSTLADGAINIQTGATMVWDFGGTFSNEGTIVIGQILSSNGGNGSLGIDGSVTLNEGGTLDLGQVSSPFQAESTGSIANSGMTLSDTLINADNTISGGGTISVSVFDNQANGVVEASQSEGFALQITSGTFSNEGTMVAESRALLDLGLDGGSGSLTNTGTIELQNDGDLFISGNFTISGSGSIVGDSGGGGEDITSDGAAAATFTNENTIEYAGSGQIGDAGVLSGVTNDLTFNNSGGTVGVKGAGHALTLNTGGHTITDNGGGLFLAQNNAQMNIDSAVTTGGSEFFFMGHLEGGGGSIEAESGGTVTISSSVTPGGSGILFGSGQILIEGGKVEMAAGATDTTPIAFSGIQSTLQLDSASNTVGTISGMADDDFIDLRYQSFAAGLQRNEKAVFSSGTLSLIDGGATLASFTLSGSYTSADFTVKDDGHGGTEIESLNPPLAAGATDVMIMEQTSNGTYEIYDIANNSFAAAYQLGQITTNLTVADLGAFNGSDIYDMLMRDGGTGEFWMYDVNGNSITNVTDMGNVGTSWQVLGDGDFSSNTGETDMLMRNSTGAIELYDIAGGQISGAHSLGNIGTEWQVLGIGGFSSNAVESDMLMRDVNNGNLELYDIAGNNITGAQSLGSVGTEWQVLGFGNFSSNPGENDMLMRDVNNGNMELYDIAGNALTGAHSMGSVGTEWQVLGFGDFSSNPSENDMLMRDVNNGNMEVYDIAGNTLTGAHSMGSVGTAWVAVGIGDYSGNPNESDLLMRNSSTGEFEVYDIAGNALTNAVDMGNIGTTWSVVGVADPPGSSPANSQLAQAMAGFATGSGVLDTSTPPNQVAPTAVTNLLATANSPSHPSS